MEGLADRVARVDRVGRVERFGGGSGRIIGLVRCMSIPFGNPARRFQQAETTESSAHLPGVTLGESRKTHRIGPVGSGGPRRSSAEPARKVTRPL
ncbi:hypothetical protein GCM10009642_11240 [Nocardiopsis metallicus]